MVVVAGRADAARSVLPSRERDALMLLDLCGRSVVQIWCLLHRSIVLEVTMLVLFNLGTMERAKDSSLLPTLGWTLEEVRSSLRATHKSTDHLGTAGL